MYNSAADMARSAEVMTLLRLLGKGSLTVLLLSLLVVEISLDLDSDLSDLYLLEIPLSDSAMLGALDVLERSTREVFLSLLPSISEYLERYSDFS